MSVDTGSLAKAVSVDEVDIFFQVIAKGCNDVFVHERIQEVVTILLMQLLKVILWGLSMQFSLKLMLLMIFNANFKIGVTSRY